MTRPNILYIHSHDSGRYVQPYGHAIPTPSIQRLAEQGVLFRQAFCANPTCSASRASLLTGLWPHCSGMIGLAHRGCQLNDYRQHLVHTLRAAGYHTALAGVQHVAPRVEMIGYDEVLDIPGDRRGPEFSRAVAEYLKAGPRQPFFLSVGYIQTHRVYPAADRSADINYCLPPAPLPDVPETRHDMACYKASARQLDDGLGTVLAALDEAGLADNTLVICTTDHGIAFPAMKCDLTDHGIGVMLIVRGPGGFTGGKACDAMVSHVDIFPTLCELLEIDPPAWLQGVSLMPLIHGQAEQVRDELFAEVTYHAAYEPMRAVRTRRWKYIRRFDNRTRPVLPNCDASPSKDIWLEAGWQDRPPEREQLYDLMFDPNEARNLAGEAALADVLADMRSRLDRYMVETDDPLLKGPVPLPEGAWVNDPDDLHPGGDSHRKPPR